ncbi:MAG: hypothetical protein KA354_15455 [Phycisphaerae bacterium]|nr:hypothetical protein [Phycisphaerae bacterium]
MRLSSPYAVLICGIPLLLSFGCQQEAALLFHRSTINLSRGVEQGHARLIADQSDPRGAATQPASSDLAATQPASTRPKGRVPYTVPGSRAQQLSLLAALALSSAAPNVTSAGKELSQSSVTAAAPGTPLGGSGLAGLGAPQPRTLTAVVGQPGLQRGLATGLGLARASNLLAPRANPLTGPNGRCSELVGVGLFPNQAACQQYFGK